jgi:hypothetical protein
MADQNWAFVSAAYAATWVMMLGYWVHVHRALRRARRSYEEATAGRPGGAS